MRIFDGPGVFDQHGVLQHGGQALHQPAVPVTCFDGKLAALVVTMWDVCHAAGGIGLAAPQIGVGLQVFVAFFDEEPVVAVNPVLSRLHGSVHDVEGCLSIKDRGFVVPRANSLRLDAFDETGSPFSKKLTGWPARVAQHECDHLAGLLISDRGMQRL